jgi:hypothetical protein
VASWAGGPAPDLEQLSIHGTDPLRLRGIIAEADLLWNFACAVPPPLLERFRRRALIDGDPGIIQISQQQHGLGLARHHILFTAGLNVGAGSCLVPVDGRTWRGFPQFVHLPAWPEAARPAPDAPITSITQWGWGELWHEGRSYSVSKRDAYMRFADLPRRCRPRFELAANIDVRDPTGDLPRLRAGGWTLANPHTVAGDPERYRAYIAASRAEFCCPKPVYVDLRTGWFSDRSAAYLATGRPVLMEETGVSAHLPAGAGLLTWVDTDTAAGAVADLEEDYDRHATAARELAETHLAASVVLPRMLEACA